MRKAFLLIVALLIGGCQSGASLPVSGSDPTEEVPEAILSPDVIVIDDAGLGFVSESDGVYVLRFVGDAPDVHPGSILLSATGEGFLRKVLSVSIEGDTIYCNTEQATLEQAFETLAIDRTIDLSAVGLKSAAPLMKGVYIPEIKASSVSKESVGTFLISLSDLVAYDADGDESTTNDQVTISGSIRLSPQIDFRITISDFSLQYLYFTSGIAESAEITASASAGYSFEKEFELARYSFATIVITTPIPVTLTPQLVVKAGIKGSAGGTVVTGVTQSLTFTAGVQYANSSWDPVINKSLDFGFELPSLSASAGIKAYAGPELMLKIYGVAGPYVDAEGYLRLAANPSATPWWGLYAGLGIGAGAKLEVLSHVLASYEVSVLDYEVLLAGAAASCRDDDGDNFFNEAGCGSDVVDCDDADPNNWTACATCADSDGDLRYTGCDSYAQLLGPDCDDGDPSNWDSCGTCQDADGDDYYIECDSYDAFSGEDCDDADPHMWQACSTCVDEDGDGYHVGCDDYSGFDHPEIDCNDSAHFVYPLADELCDGIDNQCEGDPGFGVVDEGCIQYGSASRIDSDYWHTCAVVAGGAVSCWGRNQYGQLCVGDTTTRLIPTGASGLAGVTSVTTGMYNTCVIMGDKTVRCCGYGWILGNGEDNPANSNVPVQAIGIDEAEGVAIGWMHACAVLESGEVKCWGLGGQGELGQGELTAWDIKTHTTPSYVVADHELNHLTGVRDVAVGNWHTCALMNDGSVKCWGMNDKRQLGTTAVGYDAFTTVPVVVENITDAQAIVAGAAHTCVIRSGGTVACWGSNADKAIGLPLSTAYSVNPVAISGISGAVSISASNYHSCVVMGDKTAKCWGASWYGASGNGSETTEGANAGLDPAVFIGPDYTPGDPTVMSAIEGLSAGGTHSCLIRTDGSAYCVGSNAYGRLGDANGTIDDSTAKSLIPVAVTGIGP